MTFALYGYLSRSDDEDREAMAQIEAGLIGGEGSNTGKTFGLTH